MLISHIASPSFTPAPHFTLHKDTTLLFADISGYTALAQSLGSAGAAGTEMLSQSLDVFFGIAISSIYKYNGDVIKFCGDAILCVFEPSRTTTPTAAALAATCCSLELKAKLRFFQAAENVTLDLKQMLSHGDIVGNYGEPPELLPLVHTCVWPPLFTIAFAALCSHMCLPPLFTHVCAPHSGRQNAQPLRVLDHRRGPRPDCRN